MTHPFAASVILPTHNRAQSLARCLHHVLSLDLRGERYEVIVVANACTDRTVGVVRAAQARHPRVPLHLIHEPKLGASAARNAGIRVAQGQVLCFTEDDAYPAPEWLDAILTSYRNPRV